MLPYLYISDTHFGHANIITHAARPFPSVHQQDAFMWQALYTAAEQGRIVHAGDVCLNSRYLASATLPNAERHLLVMGNHDPDKPTDVKRYQRWFGTIVGSKATWQTHRLLLEDWLEGARVRVAVSHEPLPPSADWDYNCYGHHHNNLIRFPELYGPGGRWGDYTWLRGSPRHFNICAEVLDYRPRPLHEVRELGVWR